MRTPLRLGIGLLLALASVAGSGAIATAQDIAPAAIARDHPGYLQAGTCDRPGDPVAALALTATGEPDDGAGTPTPGVPLAIPAAVSVTDVRGPLADLLQAGLIIRVVASEDDQETAIACGGIAGRPDSGGNVYLALSEQNASGLTGVVWLQPGDDDNTTTVTLFLIPVSPGNASRG